jgi:hypothetical protein
MSRTAHPKQQGVSDGSQPGETAAPRKPWVWPRCEILDFDDTEAGPAGGFDAFSSAS